MKTDNEGAGYGACYPKDEIISPLRSPLLKEEGTTYWTYDFILIEGEERYGRPLESKSESVYRMRSRRR